MRASLDKESCHCEGTAETCSPTMSAPADDPLRPDDIVSFQVSTYSQSTWHASLSTARSLTHLPYCCSDIKSLLNQTPSIPDSDQVIETIGTSSLSLEGHATWDVSPKSKETKHDCELPPIKKTLPRKIHIGESRPGICSLSNCSFSGWPGLYPLRAPTGNYLAVFVLGWSYVLSARLIELRQKSPDDKVVFTDTMALWTTDHSSNNDEAFELDTGCRDIAEVRWWAAILAGGRGWQATLTREDKTFFPPWECHLDSSSFRVSHRTGLPSSNPVVEPPSSAQAQEYLLSLARRYDAFDQLICALSATMTLPMQNRFGASINLPKPISGPSQSQHSGVTFSSQIPTYSEIPKYMAFSGISGLLCSCLFGSFWEKGISCNLVSEWLNPALKSLSDLSRSDQPLPILWAMSKRRPKVASLWLGATITGLLPRILQVSRSLLPTIYLEAVAWTQSPQSFMDPPNYRHVKPRMVGDRAMIPREDEFRLLFLTDTLSETYGNPPICPYAPFGEVDLQETSIEVRLHHSCKHGLVYRSWQWKCRNGQSLSDFGASNDPYSLKSAFMPKSLLSIWMLTGVACATLLHKSHWILNLRQQYRGFLFPGSLAIIVCFLRRPAKVLAYKHFLTVHAWIERSISVASSKLRLTSRQTVEQEAGADDQLSGLATRGLFSWTYFSEGTRAEEKGLLEHDWLEILADAQDFAYSSESSSSGIEGETKRPNSEYIRKWQQDVSVQAESDPE